MLFHNNANMRSCNSKNAMSIRKLNVRYLSGEKHRLTSFGYIIFDFMLMQRVKSKGSKARNGKFILYD